MKRFLKTLGVAVIWLVGLLAGVACGSTGGEPKPPDIAYGRDMCDRCGMVIDDPRFAAALLLGNGQTVKFDDAGEAFTYVKEHSNETVRAWFVHDFQTQEWVRGEQAFFVVSDQVRTPMGTGVAVFGNRQAADTYAKGLGAKALTLDEARAAVKGMGMGK